MLEPVILEKPELTVVGFEASFIHALSPDANNFNVIGPLWDKIGQASNSVPHRLGHDMVGIVYGRPEDQRGHPQELQYIAGVPVSARPGGAADDIPDGMVSHTIPATTFAVFTHRGPIAAIRDTVFQIYRVWLPQSDYQHAQIADVELYDHRFHCERDDSEMEYRISVKKKSMPE